MPSISVAPVYSDPWVKDHYEGMAKLIEQVVDVADKTLNAITCQLWCIRFFYTEINVRRWVDVAEIDTWQDSLDRLMPLNCGDSTLDFWQSRTCVELEATAPGDGTTGRIFLSPPLAVGENIIGIGCSHSIPTVCGAASQVSMTLWTHDEDDPTAAATVLHNFDSFAQSNNFVEMYEALASVHEVEPSFSYTARIFMKAVEEAGGNGFLRAKAPFLRLERTI